MDNVYIIGIIALALVIIVWLLRARIISGSAEVDMTKKRGSAKFQAAEPSASTDKSSGQASSSHNVVLEGNRIVGSGLIRILQRSVRVTKNWVVGKPTIEVKDHPDPVEDESRPGRNDE